MNRFVIYIHLPAYLSEWLTARLGNPVRFPASSPQNAVLRTFLIRRPDKTAPDTGADGGTAIVIPDSVSKPAEFYNHMSHRGKIAVAETCKDLFLRALWTDLSPLSSAPVGINKLIAAWCETNGIDLDHVEAVRQCFYRIRKEYARSGINLSRSSKKKLPQS